jgi:hypothetical protein
MTERCVRTQWERRNNFPERDWVEVERLDPKPLNVRATGPKRVEVNSLHLELHPHDGYNISHRDPQPAPRGQLRADSRVEL